MPRNEDRLALGRLGEDWIAGLAEARGWTILARNWRRQGVELDVVALRDANLLILEVKTRRHPQALEDPHLVLSWTKRSLLIRGAQHFLSLQEDLPEVTIRIYLAVVMAWNGGFSTRWYPIDV